MLPVRQNSSVVMSATPGAAKFAFGAILFVAGRVLATKISEATFAAGISYPVVVGLLIFSSLQTVILTSR
jgi:hypothetical protein